jgi:hypothetical protein
VIDANELQGIGNRQMATFTQAIESANKVLADNAVASVNIEFISSSGVAMTATVTRNGLTSVKVI